MRQMVLILALYFLIPVFSLSAKDIAGAQDHPLISRFEGAEIRGYTPPTFEEVELPLSPYDYNSKGFEKSLTVVGKLTRILYLFPEKVSSLEVFENYKQGLRKKNFEILYECSQEKCGSFFKRYIFSEKRRPRGTGYAYESLFWEPSNQRYLVAKLLRPEGDLYVSLYVAKNGFKYPSWAYNRVTGILEVIEVEPVPLDQIEVTPEYLSEQLNQYGKVSLYNIYFDHDKAELKPESKPALTAIAELLKSDTALKLYVVGHTDSTGKFEYNKELSQKRAEAVVDALVTDYGIERERLFPWGVGPLAPVASNETPEGRAKNRRVELVKQ